MAQSPEWGGEWRVESQTKGSDQQREHSRQKRLEALCDGAEEHGGKEEETANRAVWESHVTCATCSMVVFIYTCNFKNGIILEKGVFNLA